MDSSGKDTSRSHEQCQFEPIDQPNKIVAFSPLSRTSVTPLWYRCQLQQKSCGPRNKSPRESPSCASFHWDGIHAFQQFKTASCLPREYYQRIHTTRKRKGCEGHVTTVELVTSRSNIVIVTRFVPNCESKQKQNEIIIFSKQVKQHHLNIPTGTN